MYLGNSPERANKREFVFFASSGQSIFTGADANGLTLSYTPKIVSVFVNGSKLVNNEDYIADDGVTITINGNLDTDDVVYIESFAPFKPADTYSIAEANSIFKNASNLTSGTIPDDRLPSRLVGGQSVTDWNNATTPGFYITSNNTPANSPVAGYFYGIVQARGNVVIQDLTEIAGTVIDANADRSWRRIGDGTNWGAWIRLYDTESQLDARYITASSLTVSTYWKDVLDKTEKQSSWIAMGGAANHASNGYEKSPMGGIRQWGVSATTSGGVMTLYFPISFPNGCKSIVGNVNGQGVRVIAFGNLSAAGCSVYTFLGDGTPANGGFFWQAVGY